ncbi:MAG: hypothetical protein HY221_00910 [Candidatus Sungbacteria bacterium]|uniref:Uncharacterized protein n=1 Tax=Candidatus Sungiibacteriota bacterium TaxID=2750080 RepID=A0A932VS74_9BACT|nr:hypothetical protein [Candidatus Sungbacteria bacterium]
MRPDDKQLDQPGLPSLPQPSVRSVALASLLSVFYLLFLAHPVNLTTADLGRHLKNGQILFETGSLIATNFYSYTQSSFPTVNHHWGSGLLFYFVWRLAGFTGLHIFFIGMSLGSFLIFLALARREAGNGVSSLLAIPTLFLLAERTEIRPEVFSYLLAGIFIWLLVGMPEGKKFLPRALALAAGEILWVNTHIYFFLGPLIVTAFLIEAWVWSKASRKRMRVLGATLALVAGAMLVNPFGFSGISAPFTILRNYGYRVAENQPVWFMERIMADPNFLIFKGLFILLAASFVIRFLKQKNVGVAYALLALGASTMAWLQVRNLALFGLFSLPIIAANLAASRRRELIVRLDTPAAVSAAAILALLFIPASFGHLQAEFPYWHEFGLGLASNNSRAADFFKANDLHGPIFNNYDIGGYLIFHLFPQEKIFADNRPEAYPASFFQDTYIPMQERSDAWRAAQAAYRFNAIFFFWRDVTPWAQSFLAARLNDPDWAPVFADENALIFLRENDTNRQAIKRYQIPKNVFRITPVQH